MPPTALAPPDTLKDLLTLVQTAEGFPALLAALRQGHGATVDGAWASSAGLVTATLAREAPRALLAVLAHPRDLDGWAGDLQSFAGLRPALFPAWDNQPGSGPVDEVAGQRLRLLKQLEGPEPPRLVLTTFQALLQPVPDRKQLAQNRRVLRAGETVGLEELADWLVGHGYQPTDAVELPGEFSRRGGILDVFSPDAEAPFRVEFFGDEVESIRQFSPGTQRSLGTLTAVEMSGPSAMGNGEWGVWNGRPPLDSPLPTPHSPLGGHFCDYLPADAWVVLVESDDLREQGKHYLERVPDATGLFSVAGAFQQLLRFPSVKVSALPSPTVEATAHLRVESVERFSGDVSRVRDELDSVAASDRVLIACHNEAECKRLGEVLAAGQLAQTDRLRLVTGRVRAGFRVVDVAAGGGATGVVVLGGQELFHREEVRQVQPRRRLESRAIDSFLDLAEGDLVVHVSHGIARYRGMQLLEKDGAKARHSEEHLILEFRDGVRVYVPASKIDLVQKYVGGSNTQPELSKVGGTSWQNRKARVQEAVLDLASDMIALQALREAEPGTPLPPDSEWQAEF
ncbi:MAG TPA: CarD family transcriptional regulator, partial [Gemmataceae bacterium]|nr:CarD family transcriptional regulator [Gemmataceae bacterium]